MTTLIASTAPPNRVRVTRHRYTGQLCGPPAQHIDHIVPLAEEGTDGARNLRADCAACNLSRNGGLDFAGACVRLDRSAGPTGGALRQGVGMLRMFGRHVRQHFVGYLALFIALGGVSYAAVTLPRNSVGTAQIKPGAVKSSDLGKNAVTTAKVKDFSLLSEDFKPGQLVAGAPGATGPKGDKGDPGTNGTNGTTGPAGPSHFAQVATGATSTSTPTFRFNSAGFTSVSRAPAPNVGRYCLNGLGSDFPAVVAPSHRGTLKVGFVVFDSFGDSCTVGVGVYTYDVNGNPVTGLDFDIVAP